MKRPTRLPSLLTCRAVPVAPAVSDDTILRVDQADELASRMSPSCLATRFQVPLPPELAEAAQGLVDAAPFHIREPWRVSESLPLEWFGPLAGLPVGQWLAAESARLAQTFARVVGADEVRVHVMHTASDECTRAHVDHVALRLVTTWIGPGTHWYSPSDVRWEPAAEGRSMRAAAPFLVVPGAVVQQSATGEALLMKGLAWTERPGRGLVHWSPRVSVQGLRRLVLRVDTLDACGC
jgi:hypothetical protein